MVLGRSKVRGHTARGTENRPLEHRFVGGEWLLGHSGKRAIGGPKTAQRGGKRPTKGGRGDYLWSWAVCGHPCDCGKRPRHPKHCQPT